MTQDPYRYFRLEARELLDRLQSGVLELERGAGPAVVKELLRIAHTLKGAARAVRLPAIAEHAHAIEDALEVYRETGAVARPVIEALLPRLDDLELRVRAIARPPREPMATGAGAIGRASIRQPATSEPTARPPVAPGSSPAGQSGMSFAGQPGSSPAGLPDSSRAGQPDSSHAGLPDSSRGGQPDSSSAGPPRASDLPVPAAAVAPILRAAEAPPAIMDGAVRALRVETGDMDRVLEGLAEAHAAAGALRRLAGELDHAHRLAGLLAEQLAPRAAPSARHAHDTAEELHRTLGAIDRGLGTTIDQLDRELRGTRDTAEQLRLTPASALFTPLERSARDAARALGKDIGFEHRGGDVRLDAHVLAAVQPALLQLVRNAVAHGIEPPAERHRRGKPAAGQIAIEVERHARRVIFRCRDDGRGLDVDVLREAAIRRGAAPHAADMLTAGELVQLLLRGGITTSATVTEIAGRGVGLDVVRDAVTRLGGRVNATSGPDGTTFELEVPVSLAAVTGLTVDDAGAIATIPLAAVRRAIRLAATDIVATPDGAAIVHDGQVVPFLSLGAVLGRADAPAHRAWSAVIVEDRGRLVALGVSRLLGTAIVVVRSLPDLAPADPVVGGASLDADGTPQLVLDPAGLVAAQRRAVVTPVRNRPRILVIDDSVTTRMLEQSILESAGYDVDLATSAEDGLVRARAAHYALFLVDVEMPGMDGFTFIEHVQRDPTLRATPAILVTSRASPADRARGRDVGARGYIAKGEFDQAALLDQIAKLVA